MSGQFVEQQGYDSAEFQELADAVGVTGCFEVRESDHGRGLYATRDLEPSQVCFPRVSDLGPVQMDTV